jgi:hypothetical protein
MGFSGSSIPLAVFSENAVRHATASDPGQKLCTSLPFACKGFSLPAEPAAVLIFQVDF